MLNKTVLAVPAQVFHRTYRNPHMGYTLKPYRFKYIGERDSTGVTAGPLTSKKPRIYSLTSGLPGGADNL